VKTYVEVPLGELEDLYEAVLYDHIDGDWIPSEAREICEKNLPEKVKERMDLEYEERSREARARGCTSP